MKTNAWIQVPEEEKGQYYWIKVICINCRFKSSVAIKKGYRVDDAFCPTCENVTLEVAS